MTHGSLFSGIGGFDLAAEWRGWENVFHCERNEFGQKVLKYYWPKADSYNDIKTTDFTIYRGRINVLTGGFPCQPYSQAGNRKGKADERHLWPEMLRAVREIQPDWVVGENVRGLINWDGGVVFDEVQADLEAAGYEVFPFLLPAAGVNAPHERYRIWFVAYAGRGTWRQRGQGFEAGGCFYNGQNKRRPETADNATGLQAQGLVTDAIDERLQVTKQKIVSGPYANNERRAAAELHSASDWAAWPTQWPVHTRDDGLSTRLDGITFPHWRNETIKAGGNAIVPQVAVQIFTTIEEFERTQ